MIVAQEQITIPQKDLETRERRVITNPQELAATVTNTLKEKLRLVPEFIYDPAALTIQPKEKVITLDEDAWRATQSNTRKFQNHNLDLNDKLTFISKNFTKIIDAVTEGKEVPVKNGVFDFEALNKDPRFSSSHRTQIKDDDSFAIRCDFFRRLLEDTITQSLASVGGFYTLVSERFVDHTDKSEKYLNTLHTSMLRANQQLVDLQEIFNFFAESEDNLPDINIMIDIKKQGSVGYRDYLKEKAASIREDKQAQKVS